MPLPTGWTATVTQADRDDSHVPVQYDVVVTFSDSNGVSFPVHVRLNEPDVMGRAQQEWINMGWSKIGSYVLATIDQLTAPAPAPPPPSPFVGEVIAIP